MWYGRTNKYNEDEYVAPAPQKCECNLLSQLENEILKQLLEEHFTKVLEKDE